MENPKPTPPKNQIKKATKTTLNQPLLNNEDLKKLMNQLIKKDENGKENN